MPQDWVFRPPPVPRLQNGVPEPALNLHATGIPTLDSLSLSATGAVAVSATSSVTLGDVTSSPNATGVLAISGSTDATLAAITITDTAQLAIQGSASISLDASTVSSGTAQLAIQGTLSATLDSVVSTQATVLQRIAYGRAWKDWQILGKFPTGVAPRESDIYYNASDGYFYLFGTGGDGNVPPGGSVPDPHVSMWKATSLKELCRASGSDYVAHFQDGMYYPSMASYGGNYYLTGTEIGGVVFVGTSASMDWSGSTFYQYGKRTNGTNCSPIRLQIYIDADIARNPSNSYWYMVALNNPASSLVDMRIWRNDATINPQTPGAADNTCGWVTVQTANSPNGTGSIVFGGSPPSYAA